LQETLEWADRDGRFKIHFATAREAFNIALAAVDGHGGDPGRYRNYRLRPIRQAAKTQLQKGRYHEAMEASHGD
jgi:hypothetical protein